MTETSLNEIHLQNKDTLKGKYLTFWTADQLFGVPIADVVQIIGVQKITEIPDFPVYGKGIINLRGNIIPVIDMRLRLHKEEVPYNERTCIIVTNINSLYIGFIVDSVDEVTLLEDAQISPAPSISVNTVNAYLTGIGKLGERVVLLLDTSKILTEEDIETVAAAVEE